MTSLTDADETDAEERDRDGKAGTDASEGPSHERAGDDSTTVPEKADANRTVEESATVSLRIADGVTARVPEAADESEAAAIVAAIGAHLNDRRAAAARSDDESGPERADPWKLRGRLEAIGRRQYPRNVEGGREWSAAGRSFDR